MPAPAAHLHQHEIPGIAKFTEGPGGLPCLDLTTSHSTARIFLLGAHVAAFQKHDDAPLLFMSARSLFVPGKAIRGGVPVIFPWFGPRAENPSSPAHGFARTREWTVESVTALEDGSVRAAFMLESTEETRASWPFDFLLRYEVVAGAELQLSLSVENRSAVPFTFEEALHTYLAVSDVRNVPVSGLAGVEYIDKVDGFLRKTQEDSLITFSGETDRVYLNTADTCIAEDRGLSHQVTVKKDGSATTVVWNPWIAKSAALPDFGDDEWPGMLCIETANAAENQIVLGPGEIHQMSAVIGSESLQVES